MAVKAEESPLPVRKGALFNAGLPTVLHALLVEASAAVHRAISAGLEGHLGGLATLGANDIVHRAIAAVETAVGSLALVTAGLAAARLILEALIGVELLLGRGENELIAALTAYQSLVFEHGKKPS
jgi:hypothetical protein